MEPIADTRPHSGQLEVSVFGPGYGESVVIHMGENAWIIVDSCINPSNGKPAPLEYLERIGVDPASAVCLVVATHWHDDHIRGLSRVFRACKQAEFSTSIALESKRFLALVQARGTRHMMSSSGVDEFYEIHSMMADHARVAAPSKIHPRWAIAERLLWQQSPSGAKTDFSNQIYALSPSDAEVSRSLEEIASFFPTERTEKRRIVARSPNHCAVVLWVIMGGTILLLGSDLEEGNDPSTGWTRILVSTTRPVGKACIFKVPHHGSHTGDHPGTWADLLSPQPLCVLTPFWRGTIKLPTQSDIERINHHTDAGYISSNLKTKRIKRPKPVEEMLRDAVRSIHPVHGSFGHVRIRSSNMQEHPHLSVSLFGDAIPLKAFRA